VNGCLPIHKAAMEGHLAIIKELVAGGSPVRPQNNEGGTCMHVCAALL
jgi:ankyrin repeat protein